MYFRFHTMRKSWVLILIIGLSLAGFSQQNSGLLCALGSCEGEIDTSSINNIHRYNPNVLGLGNLGLRDYSLRFDIKQHSKFQWSRLHRDHAIKFTEYDVKRPYTNVAFMMGSKLEQVLSILHTQNISEQANFSFDFQKDQSEGFYINQASNNVYFNSNIWFKTKSENYKVSLSGVYNRIFNELNGGIETDSIFEQDSLLNRNRQLMDVNLEQASSTQKKSLLNLLQQFYFVNTLDSLGNGVRQGIALNASIENNNRVFKDTLLNLDYYENVYLDSTETKDSLQYWSTSAKFSYVFEKTGKNNLLIAPFVAAENIRYRQYEVDTFVLVNSVGGLVDFKTNKAQFVIKGDYFLDGYRKKDLKLNSKINYALDGNWNINLDGGYSNISPSLDLITYQGNNYKWANSFENTQLLNFGAKISSVKHKMAVGVSYNDLYNPIYFNSVSSPQQIDGAAQIIQTNINKEFTIKKWSIDLGGMYQYKGGYDLFQLPEIVAKLTAAKKIDLFKNNLHLFAGVDVVYYTGFNALDYNPAIDQFYLSNQKEIGNYPIIDVFVNAKIQSVRFFIKTSHANEGLMGYKYYGAFHYPLRDRSFQFGINWSFLN